MSALRRHGRRSSGGQALVELALGLPIVVTLAVGTFDLGTVVAEQSTVSAAAGAGIAIAIQSATSDVGTPIRNESSLISATGWGNGNASGSANCVGAAVHCGDTQDCATTSSWWTTGVSGCYSLATCTVAVGPPATCTPSNWGAIQSQRPSAGGTTELVVRVAIRVTPVTPLVKGLAPSGVFTIIQTVTSVQAY